ncbi:MAG: serine hydrolase domain-containing protein [Gemmatimonadales bacterium]
MNRIVLATALLGALTASGGAAQVDLPRARPEDVGLAAAPLETGIRAAVSRAVEEQSIAGAVVGVARHGRIAYLESFGIQDVGTRAPMTERSLFRIYSMTKAVTAVAVMMLHEEGRFELSDPASTYLPALADVVVLNADGSTRAPVRPITIRDLLLHTSGFSHRTSAEYRDAGVRARDMTLDRMIENMVRVPLRFDPGAGYLYSESPTVLGRLVEIWSGRPFDEFLRERIFEPLGMADTGFWVEPARAGRLTAVHAPAEGGGLRAFEIEAAPFTVEPTLLEGAVGLVSTVPDFLRFAEMLANRGELGGVRLLRESTVDAMTRNGLSTEIMSTRRGGTGWGLGNVSVLMDADEGSGARAGEYRWDGSAGTEFWVDPASGTTLVTMWQSQPANPQQLRQRITAAVREAIQR